MERAYDTVEGIKTYLKDLEGLNRLKKDRMEAGYERKERLQDFLILGRWMTDSCGNFGDCTLLDDRYKPMDIAAGMPQVVPRDDVFKLFHVSSTSTSGTRCCVPPVRVHCRECGQRWTLSNAHDAIVDTETCKVDMAPYVGRTFRDLDNDLRAKVDGAYFMGYDLPLKHERFVDLTPHPTIPDFVENRDGWVNLGDFLRRRNKGDDLTKFFERLASSKMTFSEAWDPWNYVFQEGDYTYGHAVYYTHRRCHALKKSRDSRDYYAKIFLDAGFSEPVTHQVPNERCQEQCCMPWIVGEFPFGSVKIGWRSSVINIDWTAFPGSPDYECLFDGEETTKGPTHVHAHGREKAVEYLKRLKMAVDAGLKCEVESGCHEVPTQFLARDEHVTCRCAKHRLSIGRSVSFLEALVLRTHST